MATTESNRQSYYPPISSNPTPAEMALHLRLLYSGLNNHDSAINLLSTQNTASSSSSNPGSSITELVTKTIISTQLPGLGGINDQTGNVSYSVVATDNGILLVLNDSSPVAVTLNSAMITPYFFFAANLNAIGSVTFTPSLGTINGGASFVLIPLELTIIAFNGTNWVASVSPIVPQNTAPITHEFLTAYNGITGAFLQAQPAVADVVGAASIASPTFTGTVTQPDSTVLTAATTSASATSGAATLPTNPVGFLEISINGTPMKVPYYSV